MSTPALAIDGVVRFAGRVPTVAALRDLLAPAAPRPHSPAGSKPAPAQSASNPLVRPALLECLRSMRRTFRPWGAICGALLTMLAAAACDQASLPPPSNSGGIPFTDRFTGTLQPSGSAFYSFRMSEAGNVQVTLISMTGNGIPGDATFPIGIGTPSGAGCSAGIDAAVTPGPSPQVTVPKSQGVYCVLIFDNAKLTEPAAFVINITHPR